VNRQRADRAFDNATLQFASSKLPKRAYPEDVMLKWSVVYFLLAIASGVLGVVDTNMATAILAQVFFFANVVVFVVFTLLGAIRLSPDAPGDSGER
jgi:uncharacterized membrane protein YtjA (UPF0391 family)